MTIRHVFLRIALVSATASGRIEAQIPWTLVAPIPPHIKAYSAVTVGNRAYFWGPNNIIVTSYDAGKTFATLTPYGPVYNVVLGCCANQGVAFADSLTGYVADLAHGEFRTEDGGNTWQQMAQVGSNIELVLFGSESVGWKFGMGGSYRTTDAGATWTFLSTPFGYGGIWAKAFALDDSRVWITKSFYNGTALDGSMWYSPNAGTSWSRVASAPMSDATNEVTYSDLRFNRSGIGIATGSIKEVTGVVSGFAVRTTDFGTSWSRTLVSAEVPKNVLSLSDSLWIIFGGSQDPLMWRSSDSGISWAYGPGLFTVPGYNAYGASTYLPATRTLLVSTEAGMYRSTDLGLGFRRVADSLDLPIIGLSIDLHPGDSTRQTVIARSPQAGFLHSEDGGVVWKKGNLPAASMYTFAQMVIAGDVIFASPDQQYIYKSTDRGVNWTEIPLAYWGGLMGLAAYDKDHLVVQGYDVLFSSSDGGMNWTRAPFPGQYWINECAMIGPGVITAAGGHYDTLGYRGFIYSTSTSGFEWRIRDFPREIKHLKMTTASKGFATSDYEVYRTLDGGRTWDTMLSSKDYYQAFGDMFFADSLNGLLRQSTTFLSTVDGGTSWSPSELTLPLYSVSNFVRTRTGALLAAGEGMLWRLRRYGKTGNGSQDQSPTSDLGSISTTMDIFPNPFNPETNLAFSIGEKSQVELQVFDILGRKVAELVHGELEAGNHAVQFNASRLSSGTYIFALRTNHGIVTRKALLLR